MVLGILLQIARMEGEELEAIIKLSDRHGARPRGALVFVWEDQCVERVARFIRAMMVDHACCRWATDPSCRGSC